DDIYTWDAIRSARTGVGFTPPQPLQPKTVPAPGPPIYSAGPLPARFLDTRPGFKTADGLFQGSGPRGFNDTIKVKIAGRGTIPGNASAVTLNVTVLGQGNGYVTVYPCDGDRPWTSNLNVRNGQTISNLVVTKLSASGEVCIYTQAPANLLIDVFNVI